MITHRIAGLIVISALVSTSALAQQPRPIETRAWALKPIKTPAYTPGLKPWIKIADLKTKHRGQTTWHEVAVDDGRLTGEYVAAAPGTRVSKRFHPDTREWFAVLEAKCVWRSKRRSRSLRRAVRS
jgi:hypothetical protein